MKTIIITSALAALLVAGVAAAQPAGGARTLSRAEFSARADRQFAQLDANDDGVATAAELAGRKQARRERRGDTDRVARRFARMDADGNGAITLTEMRATHTGRVGKPGGPGKRARGIGRMDGDGNGAVSRAEFQAQALTRFARLDGNGDGTVTPSERQAARQDRRGR